MKKILTTIAAAALNQPAAEKLAKSDSLRETA
jgi:hypothetical protein